MESTDVSLENCRGEGGEKVKGPSLSPPPPFPNFKSDTSNFLSLPRPNAVAIIAPFSLFPSSQFLCLLLRLFLSQMTPTDGRTDSACHKQRSDEGGMVPLRFPWGIFLARGRFNQTRNAGWRGKDKRKLEMGTECSSDATFSFLFPMLSVYYAGRERTGNNGKREETVYRLQKSCCCCCCLTTVTPGRETRRGATIQITAN